MKFIYIKCLVLVLLVFSTISCEDLTERPEGLLSPNGIYSSATELKAGVNGAYGQLAREEFFGRKLPLALLVRSDMVGIGDPGTPTRRINCDEMAMELDNGLVNAFWPQGYRVLGAANNVINAVPTVEGSEEEINAIAAQAYFIRAYVHFVFVRLFGQIIYSDGIARDDFNAVQQYSVAETYAGIIDDLNFASVWLDDIPVDRTHPGKAAAFGMLASVYATKATHLEAAEPEDWENAYQNAMEVINNEARYNIGLETDFADIFAPDVTSNEILYYVQYTANDNHNITPGELGGSNSGTDQMTSVTGPRGDERFEALNDAAFGWSAIVPELPVYSTWDGRDYRKAVSLDTAITYDGIENYSYVNWGDISQNVARPHVAKYFRAVGEAGLRTGTAQGASLRDSNAKHIILRYAEVLLTAAEAALETNRIGEAAPLINRVRARARNAGGADDANYPPRAFPEDISANVTVDDILEERRLELAFEGVRWFDIVRRRRGDVFTGAAPALESKPFEETDYLFPKYFQDVILLDGLTQNPGYEAL